MAIVLGVETSCDETAAAVVSGFPPGPGRILSNVLHSQIACHAPYGGVVPELAARSHIDKLEGVIACAMRKAAIGFDGLDAIAVCQGPGLPGALIVGSMTAKALAFAADRPFLAVNHLAAHSLTCRLEKGVPFPFLVLLLSGGHSEFAIVDSATQFRRLGGTLDDSLGECFDKVARLLGLAYPGGPNLEKLANSGDPFRFPFPHPLKGRARPDLSFSGLKTAVRRVVLEGEHLSEQGRRDVAASFQHTVVGVVAERTQAALMAFRRETGQVAPRLVAAGGVIANAAIRRALEQICADRGLSLHMPASALCGDNAAMIAWAAIERLPWKTGDALDTPTFSRWPMESYAVFLAGRNWRETARIGLPSQ